MMSLTSHHPLQLNFMILSKAEKMNIAQQQGAIIYDFHSQEDSIRPQKEPSIMTIINYFLIGTFVLIRRFQRV